MKATNPFIASVSDQSGEMVELIPQDSHTLTADEALDALECLHTYALKTAATDSFYETHNQEMNEHMRVVRDVLASLPSPPVSGEAVELLRLILPLAKGYAGTHRVGQNMAFIEQAESLLTNDPVAAHIPDASKMVEPVGVTKPKCGVAGEISLPAMGLDYFYNPSDWEWTQNADDDSCIADWLSESMVDVMEIQTLIEGPLLFAANIPTKWDEEGEVTDSEVTYFDTEEDAKSALSAAIGERG